MSYLLEKLPDSEYPFVYKTRYDFVKLSEIHPLNNSNLKDKNQICLIYQRKSSLRNATFINYLVVSITSIINDTIENLIIDFNKDSQDLYLKSLSKND